MVSQGSLLVAVHAQPVGSVTATWPGPPAAVAACEVGFRTGVHPPLPLVWVTVKVLSAVLMLPVRGEAPVKAVTEYVTTAVPLPVAPVVTVSQSESLTAVQVQAVDGP